MAFFFDYKARPIQSFSQNHLGGIDRSEYQYRFNGEVLKMRMVHQGITEIYDYAYNHNGQKVSFKHTKDGVTQNVARYDLDAIGRLKTKVFKPSGSAIGSKQTGNWTDATTWLSEFLPSVNDNVTINTGQTITIPSGQSGSAGILNYRGLLRNFGTLSMGKITTSDLQIVDFSYHIRGNGLRGINLDNAGNLTNKLFSMKLTYEDGTNGGYFDGNIRNQYWKSSIDGIQRAYEYSYDGASRITGATYAGKAGESYALNSVSYDDNGNIKVLSRNGLKSNNSFGLIDNLAYTYNANSNKILKVDDNSNETASFKDVSGNDYTYSLDGSLTSDANKGITNIEYNYLKRPKKYTFSNGSILENQYDATGKKLKSISSDGTVYDFVGNLIYKNNVLYQISHDEGRIINGEYEYEIKDHLGNLRVSFRDSLGVAKITQKQDYDIYGSELQGLSYTKPLWNQDNFKYLGRESIAQTGYIDLLNRQYDKILGRFTSPDPVTDGQESQSLFQYGWNNPVLRSDPNGLVPQDDTPLMKAVQKTQVQANKANNSFQQTKQSASEIVTVTGGGQVAGIGGGVKVGSAKVQADVKFIYAEGSLNAGEQKAEFGFAKLEVSAQATKNKSLGGSVSLASGAASSKDGYSENGGFQAGSASATKNGKTVSSGGDIGFNAKAGPFDIGINASFSKLLETGGNLVNTVVETGKTVVDFIGNYISEGFNTRTNNTFSGSKEPLVERKK